MNPESSDPPTAILCAQTLKEFTIISFLFVRHAYQLTLIYKINYRTDIVFFFEEALSGEGRLLERGTYFKDLTFAGALFREGRSLDHLW